ncbi:MAG: hypothetical protein LH617_04705 [Ramlibacter sp.]|nr:hypothetical protein [Ramlibacter sp.]
MAVSLRMDPLLEKELELAAKRKGITKSQFIVEAVERALGRKNSYELMMSLQAEEAREGKALTKAFAGEELPYDTEKSRQALVRKLRVKHGVGRTG